MATLHIKPDGVIEGVYSDTFADLLNQGEVSIRRASHVEPGRDNQGEPCWFADLSPFLRDRDPLHVSSKDDILGPFYTRKEALDNEVEWLEKQLTRSTGVPVSKMGPGI